MAHDIINVITQIVKDDRKTKLLDKTMHVNLSYEQCAELSRHLAEIDMDLTLSVEGENDESAGEFSPSKHFNMRRRRGW